MFSCIVGVLYNSRGPIINYKNPLLLLSNRSFFEINLEKKKQTKTKKKKNIESNALYKLIDKY